MAKGGARPGAGRPKGSVTTTTLEKRKTEEIMTRRILGYVNRLLNAQLAIAEGVTHVFRIDEVGEGKDKRREHVLVTDAEEIKAVLDETDGTDGTVDDGYYIITTKEPNNKAIDSMLDRVFGKARESLALSTPEDEPLEVNINISSKPIDELLRILTAKSQDSARGRTQSAKAGRSH